MRKYTNYDMCKECGGVCCKENGCIYAPRDFKRLDFSNLRKEIDKGNISISGQPIGGINGNGWTFFLYLRARNKDADIVDLFTKGGPCQMLTPEGCSLQEAKRPSFGLLVEPTKVGGPCNKKYGAEEMLEWFNYNCVLEKLVKHYTGSELIDVLASEIATRISEINKKRANQQLTSMEAYAMYWINNIIDGNPYYELEEVKQLKLKFIGK